MSLLLIMNFEQDQTNPLTRPMDFVVEELMHQLSRLLGLVALVA